MYSTDPQDRARLIAGLREVADFLAANPAVPVPSLGAGISIHTSGTDAAMCALVDQAAALLGAPIDDRTAAGGHYSTTRTFGVVTYSVVAVLDAARQAYDALMSYSGNVATDQPATATLAAR